MYRISYAINPQDAIYWGLQDENLNIIYFDSLVTAKVKCIRIYFMGYRKSKIHSVFERFPVVKLIK